MYRKIWLRILAGVVLLAAVAGIAFFAFNAGVATHVQIPATSNGQTPYPYWGYGFWHPFGFFGLGCFGPLIALFLLFLAFRALSFMFWGPRWGWSRHMSRHAWRHGWMDENGVPPMFKEWHDRAHNVSESGKESAKDDE
ncbi:MAG TPA: hypothetical protein VMT73_00135 [Anaerolineales bacterium]|nr:hypothetical protein [Anaerolineales bacterium]